MSDKTGAWQRVAVTTDADPDKLLRFSGKFSATVALLMPCGSLIPMSFIGMGMVAR
jgi:hypothetical protein